MSFLRTLFHFWLFDRIFGGTCSSCNRKDVGMHDDFYDSGCNSSYDGMYGGYDDGCDGGFDDEYADGFDCHDSFDDDFDHFDESFDDY